MGAGCAVRHHDDRGRSQYSFHPLGGSDTGELRVPLDGGRPGGVSAAEAGQPHLHRNRRLLMARVGRVHVRLGNRPGDRRQGPAASRCQHHRVRPPDVTGSADAPARRGHPRPGRPVIVPHSHVVQLGCHGDRRADVRRPGPARTGRLPLRPGGTPVRQGGRRAVHSRGDERNVRITLRY